MASLVLDQRGVLTRCEKCGKTNRLPYAGLARAVRCGQCQAPLAPPASPIEVASAAAFDALISQSALPIIVDFWAPWCGPCRMVAPELEKVARTAAREFLVVKVNTEAVPELGERFGIRSIPTMAIFHGGREITRTAGARPANDILAFARNALEAKAGSHTSA